MSKNIVLCFDGTGNEPGKNRDTNIYKLSQLLICDDRQIVFYHKGVATGPIHLLKKIFQFVTGLGVSKNIQDGYRILVENYRPGDNIFIFGFSRGAYTARSLAGMLSSVGLLKPEKNHLIGKAYNLYSTVQTAEPKEKFCTENSIPCPVHFIGVFDTVASVWLGRNRFHNTALGPGPTSAYQALAYDEKRVSFTPVLWDDANDPRIEQVWFPGTHRDIGGPSFTAGLADRSLRWMIQKARAKGLLFISNHENFLRADVDGPITPYNWIWRFYSKPRLYGARAKLHRSFERIKRENRDEVTYVD